MGSGGGKTACVNPLVMSIEHFTTERVVGEGGFGKVNAVVNKSTGGWYAMKKLLKCRICKNGSVGMIFNERMILSRVHHAHLINMHFAFQNREACFLVLDLQLGRNNYLCKF